MDLAGSESKEVPAKKETNYIALREGPDTIAVMPYDRQDPEVKNNFHVVDVSWPLSQSAICTQEVAVRNLVHQINNT